MKTQKYRINDMEYDVCVNSLAGNHAEVTVNGVTYQVEISSEPQDIADEVPQTQAVTAPAGQPAPSAAVLRTESPAAPSGDGKPVCSPLPGVIVAVKVKPGDVVKNGQVVAVLEAMKMENEIQSEYDGTVISVNVSQGEAVLEGAAIVTIA